MESSPGAVDAYLAQWDYNLPAFWRSSPYFDGRLRMLLDQRVSGTMPMPYLTHRAMDLMKRYPDAPPARIAYLIHPSSNLVSNLRTFERMTDQVGYLERAFFNANERDTAINWLLNG
jgi:hypothetical protein